MKELLAEYRHLDIDWELSPEDAVTMYLEWGNNDWRAERQPIRSKNNVSTYFIIDAWESPPFIRLIRRSSEDAVELAAFPLPDEFLPDWKKEYGTLRGVFAPPPAVREWLQRIMSCS